MAHNIAKKRQQCAMQQGFRCYYCQSPIWEHDPDTFCRRFGITAGQVPFFRSTAEHLLARQDGGTDAASNLVAACHFCNGHRHRTPNPKPPERYLHHVRRRMARGKWLAPLIGKLPDVVSRLA